MIDAHVEGRDGHTRDGRGRRGGWGGGGGMQLTPERIEQMRGMGVDVYDIARKAGKLKAQETPEADRASEVLLRRLAILGKLAAGRPRLRQRDHEEETGHALLGVVDRPHFRMEAEDGLWFRRWTSCPGGRLDLMLHPGGHGVPKGWLTRALDWFEDRLAEG